MLVIMFEPDKHMFDEWLIYSILNNNNAHINTYISCQKWPKCGNEKHTFLKFIVPMTSTLKTEQIIDNGK